MHSRGWKAHLNLNVGVILSYIGIYWYNGKEHVVYWVETRVKVPAAGHPRYANHLFSDSGDPRPLPYGLSVGNKGIHIQSTVIPISHIPLFPTKNQ